MKIATFDTDKGIIRIELFAEQTPKTVENFETLCGKEFYDGLNFHRVIRDFMNHIFPIFFLYFFKYSMLFQESA